MTCKHPYEPEYSDVFILHFISLFGHTNVKNSAHCFTVFECSLLKVM